MKRFVKLGVLVAGLILSAATLRADHLGAPETASGEVVQSVSLSDLQRILSPHGYAFSGDNYGGWHFTTPQGRDMFLNLEACQGDQCALLRINAYWELTGRGDAIMAAQAFERVVPSASAALHSQQGQVAFAVWRDVAIDLGVTTDNIVANFDIADRNVGLAHEFLLGADPGLYDYWSSLR